jgi:hypothetical protein
VYEDRMEHAFDFLLLAKEYDNIDFTITLVNQEIKLREKME